MTDYQHQPYEPAFCAVAPSPALRQRLVDAAAAAGRQEALLGAITTVQPRHFGFNDGVILPPDRFPPGSPASLVRRAAAQRAPLRGTLRVVVILVEFTDRSIGHSAADFEQLFFSEGAVPTGSVKEYYREVTNGLIDIAGEVRGPYTMPQTLAWYANGNFGIGKPSGDARAQILAQDAAKAADPDVDFGPYDNDGNGYVDAFIVVHAGSGGEETGDSGDIWSHKWVLPEEYDADGTKIYGYLTIPEDAKLGVSAHELGHLLFGFPDLYDIDGTSEGVGNWCLMGAGSWNGGGDTPAHPSAWCKANQEWVTVTNVTEAGSIDVTAVESSREVFRLWTDGGAGQEYFLLENRQLSGFDAQLPGDGLLMWHVDEAQPDNSDESHYMVGLLQADGSDDLGHGVNRGDGGDPYPGYAGNRSLDGTTTPATTSYAGQDTGVAASDVPDPADSMTVSVRVTVDGGTPGDGGDLAQRLADAEQRIVQLEQAIAGAGAALSGYGAVGSAPGGAVPKPRSSRSRTSVGSTWSRRPRT